MRILLHLNIILFIAVVKCVTGLPKNSGNSNQNGINLSVDEKNNGKQEPEQELVNLKHKDQRYTHTSKNVELELKLATKRAFMKSAEKLPANQEWPTLSDNANSEKLAYAQYLDSLDAPNYEKRKMENGPNGYELNYNPEIDYTVRDIAEYIYWTGDEKGVVSAIDQFLASGYMGTKEAVRYIEDISRELRAIQELYAETDLSHAAPSNNRLKSGLDDISKRLLLENLKYDTIGNDDLELDPMKNLPRTRISQDDLDIIGEEIITKREIALGDIIYKLLKEHFVLSSDPTKTLGMITKMVNSEAANGRLPKDLEKVILEMTAKALFHAAAEKEIFKDLDQINPPPKPTEPQENPEKRIFTKEKI